MRTQFTRISTVLFLAAAAVLVAGSANAATTTPSTWPQGEPISTLEILAIFVGGPLVLILACTLFSLVVSRNHYVPPAPADSYEVAAGAGAARGELTH
jgi:hypothetical protein